MGCVANTAGDGARRLAAVRSGEPDRGVVGILLLVDAHAHERDLRSVGRDLRVGHPHERENVLVGDIPPLCRGRSDKPEDNSQNDGGASDMMIHGWCPIGFALPMWFC